MTPHSPQVPVSYAVYVQMDHITVVHLFEYKY